MRGGVLAQLLTDPGARCSFCSFRMEVTGPEQEEQGHRNLSWPAQSTGGAGLSFQAGLGIEQLPFCCSWLSFKAELQGNCTFCAANPSSRGHLSQVTTCPAPDTLKSRCLDTGLPASPATSLSPAPVCDFFLVLVRWLFKREARHTKYL